MARRQLNPDDTAELERVLHSIEALKRKFAADLDAMAATVGRLLPEQDTERSLKIQQLKSHKGIIHKVIKGEF